MDRHSLFPETRGALTGAATLAAIAGIAFCADQIGERLAGGDGPPRPAASTARNVLLADARAAAGTTAPATTSLPAAAAAPDGPDAVIQDDPANPTPSGTAPAPRPAPAAGGDDDAPASERRSTSVGAERVSATGQTRGRWRPAVLPLTQPASAPAPVAAAAPLAPAAPAPFAAKQPVRLELRSLKRVPAEIPGGADQVELKVAALGRDNLPTASRNLSVRVAMPQEQAATDAGGSSLHLQLGLVEATGPLQLRVRIALSQAAVVKPVLSRAAPAELASDALHLWMPLASEPTTPPEDPTDPETPPPAPVEEVPAETPPPGAVTADAPPPPDATVPVDVVASLPSDTPEAPVSQTVDLAPADPQTPTEPAPAPSVTIEVGTDPEPPAPPVPPAPEPDPAAGAAAPAEDVAVAPPPAE